MYASVQLYEGRIVITATAAETYAWSKRPGAAWPCSTLADEDVEVTLDAATGDLLDVNGSATSADRDEIDAHELTAFCDDALTDAAQLLLHARRNPAPFVVTTR